MAQRAPTSTNAWAKYISKFTKLTLWGLSLTSLCLVFFAVVLLQVVLSPQPIIPAQTPNSESPCPHPRKGTPLWGAPGRCRATCRTSMVGTVVKFEFRVSGLRLGLGLGPRPRLHRHEQNMDMAARIFTHGGSPRTPKPRTSHKKKQHTPLS